MTDEDALSNLRKARGASKGKKIFFGFATFFIAIVVIAAISGNSKTSPSSQGFASAADTSTNGDTSANTDSSVTVPDTSWIPKGFYQWSNDPNVAFRWAPDGYSCNQYENSCYKAIFISQTGCPTQFYAAINLLDSSGSVIDYSNATLPNLLPMQRATLDFEDVNGNSKSAQMSEITCD